MSLLAPWLLFPVVLLALSLGCGLLVERSAGIRLDGALLVPLGLALLIVEADLVTMTDRTSQLAAPLAITLAIAGFALSQRRPRRPDGWAIGCAVAVFAVYAAPIVLSGAATFAGYITLDDTSTWLLLADRAMEHGRTQSGLEPSTYQQVITDYLDHGYPLGGFLPMGIGGKLTGQDIAWLYQPTIAFSGATLALSIYSLSSRLVVSRPLRAVVAFVAAQPALLYAYAYWSGIKELAAAALIALVCAAVVGTFDRWDSPRATVAAALPTAALFAVLSPAGAVWLLVPAIVAGVILFRLGLRPLARSGLSLIVLVALLSIPSIALTRSFVSGASGGEITTSNEVANLGHPLDTLQMLGIWPATDFRSKPHDELLTHLLIGVLLLGAVVGLVLAWKRRVWGMPLYLATGGIGIALLFVLNHIGLSSPWLNAKGMAEGSPAYVAAGLVGVAALFETGRRTEAVVMGAAIAAGVLWSNGLVYRNVWLAPHRQLAELEKIGHLYSGQGPALMTNPAPYGTRHFLRHLDPEGASERRRRIVPLLSGEGLPPNTYADIDRFQLDGILVYRTLVLPHSPVLSRPPSMYRLARRGRYYDVWQRPDAYPAVGERLPLGDELDPGAVPACNDVLRLARRAGDAGRLAAVPRMPVISAKLSASEDPPGWGSDESGLIYPYSAGDAITTVNVERGGSYRLWLGGSFRDRLRVEVDGQQISDLRYRLNDSGLYTDLGTVSLEPGEHTVRLRVGGPGIRPGSGGYAVGLGPLLLSREDTPTDVLTVPSDQARSLCNRNLDWVEALTS
jgi:hypothetical protein